jgi:hypothetical protein
VSPPRRATRKVPGAFSLIYLVFNVISNLTRKTSKSIAFGTQPGASHTSSGGAAGSFMTSFAYG